MARKEIGSIFDRNNRNNMNDNFKELYEDIDKYQSKITDKVYSEIVDSAKLDWKEPVTTYSSLPTTSIIGETRMTRDTGKVYRFDGDNWVEIQQIDAGPVNEVDSRLSSQLADEAQQRESDVLSIHANKASKTELQDGLSAKVSKGENESISMSMLSPDIKQAINDGEWNINVNTSDLEDGSATFNKRTRLGEKADIVLGTSTTKLPNIDVQNKTLKFDNTFFIISGNKRYTVSGGKTIDIAGQKDSGAVVVFFNTSDQTFSALDHRYLYQAEENMVLIATVTYNASRNGLRDVDINSQITIDELDEKTYFMKVNNVQSLNPNIDLAVIYIGADSKTPNYITSSRKLVFDGTFFVIYGNKRYTVQEGKTFDLSAVNGSGIAIYFNTITEEFSIQDARYLNPGSSDILFAFVYTYHLHNPYLKGLYITCPYTVDGNTIESTNNIYYPVSGLKLDYSPVSVNGNDFDENTTTVQDVYNKYDELVSMYPDIISKKLLGRDESDTYDIYEYEIKPPTFNNRKELPKILLNAGLHGAKQWVGDYHTTVFSLYYFVKDIVENIEDIKYNVHLKIIPIANPWGFDNKERTNSRGVDLNRNFNWQWNEGTVGDNYGGSIAFSENETKILRDWINDNEDAIFHADIHTRGGRVSSDNLFLLLPNTGSELVEPCLNAITSMSPIFNSEYGIDDFYCGKVSPGRGDGTTKGWIENIAGIPSLTFEGFPEITDYNFELSDENVLKMNTQMIGKWFLIMYEYFRNK